MTSQPDRATRLPLLLLALACALVLGVAGCGDDSSDSASDESTTSASAEDVNVTATEYEFDVSATPTADTTSITFQNDGEEPHVMILAKINEGFTFEEAFQLQGKKGSAELLGETEAKPGDSQTVELKQPVGSGHYALFCPLQTKDGEFHYKLGQLDEFDVE
jgi:hypothetical protein